MSRPITRMHRVWIVEDVIRDIMSYCVPRDVCHLGMTRHCLFQIYLDVVFGEMDSLRPLYGVLPGPTASSMNAPTGLKAFVTRHHASRAARNPKTFSVGRITMYTARVRTLTIGQGGEDDAHRISNLRSLLGPLPLQTCFPQLQSLHVIADDPNTIASAIPLALPTLRNFNLTINFEDRKLDQTVKDSYASSGLPAYIRHLRALPRLDNLTITCANTVRRDISEVEAHGLLYLSRQFPRLRTLDITNIVLTEALVYNISKMPLLERLHVCLPNGDDGGLTPTTLDFPNVRHMTVDCETATELSWFMHGLQAPTLVSLQLQVQGSAFSSQTAQKFSELVGARFRGLRAFGLHSWSADGSDSVWPFKSFHGLLQCHELEYFGVMLPSRIIATDEDMQLIVKAWPQMRDLQMGHCQASTDYERVTFGGLTALAWESSNLNSLRLAVLPALSQDRAASLLRMPTSPSWLQELSVHDLPAAKPSPAFIDGIAHVIHHLFPRMQSFTCSHRTPMLSSRAGSPQAVLPGHVERGYPLSARDIANALVAAYRT